MHLNCITLVYGVPQPSALSGNQVVGYSRANNYTKFIAHRAVVTLSDLPQCQESLAVRTVMVDTERY
jgi:hypothetical protein